MRQLSLSEHGMIVALLLIGIAVVLACTGCVSPRQHFCIGQGFDAAITFQALEVDGGYREGNPLADDMQQVLIMKAVMMLIVETAAYYNPDKADTYYKIGAVIGYGAGAYGGARLLSR